MEIRPELEKDVGEFRRLADRYAEFAAEDGIIVRPYESPTVPIFRSHPPEIRRAIVNLMTSQVSVLEEVRSRGPLDDQEKAILSTFFGRLGLVPDPAILDELKPSDVVNVFGAGQEVLFWNLDMFNYVSFTLEQMLCRPWYEFTKRNASIETKLFEYCVEMQSGHLAKTFTPAVPEHLFEELESAERLKVMIRIRRISPLTRDGAFAGFVVFNECRVVERGGKSLPL